MGGGRGFWSRLRLGGRTVAFAEDVVVGTCGNFRGGRGGWQGWVAVEPFDYVPDGPGSAAWSAGYLRGLMQGLDLGA